MSKESILAHLQHCKEARRAKVPLANRLNKALGHTESGGINPEVVEKIRKKLIPYRSTAAPHTRQTVTYKRSELAIAEHLAGRGQDKVEAKYGLGNGYVSKALKRMFPNREVLDELLENITLSNAVHANQVFTDKADTLTPKDAAIAAGIFSQRYLEIRKARNTNFQPDTPVSLVLKLEATLAKVEKQVEGKVIEDESD